MKKMKFTEDKYYNLEIIYVKDTVYEIEDCMVDRWLKRGGEIVEDLIPCPVVESVSKEDLDLLGEDVEPEAQKTEDIVKPNLFRKAKKIKGSK